MFTDLSHHRTCRSAYGGSYFGCHSRYSPIKVTYPALRKFSLVIALLRMPLPREVNDIFLRKRKSAIERYEEADGIFFGYYAQWAFMFFFYIGIICTAVITIAIIGRYCDWF